MRINKIFCGIVLCSLAVLPAGAVEITGTTSVNVTADTANAAKDKAFNSARREVVLRELGQYANTEQLATLVKNSSNDDLMNIISSSSLDGEKVSDTSYSANISFVIDGDAAKAWMEKNSVQNWLPSSDSNVVVATTPIDSVLFTAVLVQPISDWIGLNAVARMVPMDLATTSVVGNNVSFSVLDKNVSNLSKALWSNGWHVQKNETDYKIWK